MKSIVSIWLVCVLVATVPLLTGCKEPVYEGLEISSLAPPPRPAEINTDGSSYVTKGISVAISVKPLSGNAEDYQVTDDLEIVSQNEAVLLVSPSFQSGVFVLTSYEIGQTCMDVIINGTTEDCIEIEVIE